MKRGNVVIKAWDLGGQQSYRPEWSRYARGVDVIIFVVDAAEAARVPVARKELHRLLEDPALARTPLLVAANKIDSEARVGVRRAPRARALASNVHVCVGSTSPPRAPPPHRPRQPLPARPRARRRSRAAPERGGAHQVAQPGLHHGPGLGGHPHLGALQHQH